jgi:hypothetical protein
MIWTEMVVVLVNFLTATRAKKIHPSAAAKKRKVFSKNLANAGREHAEPS